MCLAFWHLQNGGAFLLVTGFRVNMSGFMGYWKISRFEQKRAGLADLGWCNRAITAHQWSISWPMTDGFTYVSYPRMRIRDRNEANMQMNHAHAYSRQKWELVRQKREWTTTVTFVLQKSLLTLLLVRLSLLSYTSYRIKSRFWQKWLLYSNTHFCHSIFTFVYIFSFLSYKSEFYGQNQRCIQMAPRRDGLGWRWSPGLL